MSKDTKSISFTILLILSMVVSTVVLYSIPSKIQTVSAGWMESDLSDDMGSFLDDVIGIDPKKKKVAAPVVACNNNANCGTSELIGSPFCQGNNVYRNYKTYICNSPGTTSSYCTNSTTAQLQTNCTGNQTCTNGSCTDLPVACTTDVQCGISGLTGSLFCQGNNVYQNYRTYTCNNPGTPASSCTNSTTAQLQTNCTGNQTCTNGSCVGLPVTCIPNYQQRCSGNGLYWYDSCGNQQGLTQYCTNGCVGNSCQVYSYNYNNNNPIVRTLTANKTVKNITSGSGFSNSVYANPSDMLMFMVTLQATGNQDIQNVIVRDILPANLIYNNQLIVACTGNGVLSSTCNNYSGNIVTGLSLNTIYSGQTVTITYQAQVAPAQNFAYGTTTLNNNVSVTSSASGYVPAGGSSVIVTRSTVLGASTISTGLTNNFWVDSFFLPLLITLIGIWMWRAGMFFWVEKWLDSKNKVRKGYKSERELSAKIAKLQKLGKV